MKWRKNLTQGCVLRRPCFCTAGVPRANACFPVRVIWPAIRSRGATGDPLFSSVDARNFNRVLRAVIRKLKVGDVERYSSHGFRRGAAQDLKTSGYPHALVAALGMWNSPVFRCYVGLTADVEQGVRRLFDVDLDAESD